jgi:hypothetical protein
MTTQETKETLPGSFAPSPLQQIGSLGTLLAAGSGKDGLFTKGFDWLGKQFGNTSDSSGKFVADPNATPIGSNWWD